MKSEENSKTNLDDLIQKIKSEGIEEAERKSEEIIKETELTASKILNKARQDARAITEEAEEEIRKKESASKMALEQAARDIILSVRTSLTEIFDSLIKKEYKKVLSGKTLETVLVKIIEGWQKNKMGDSNLELLLSESDRNSLFEGFLSKLNEEIKTGIELKVHPNIEGGFRIGIKGSHAYYDFTDEGIADALAEYLNPRFYDFIDSLKKVQNSNERTVLLCHYIIAKPFLNEELPIKKNDFLVICKKYLKETDFKILESVSSFDVERDEVPLDVIKRLFRWERGVRNALVRLRAVRLGLEPDEFVRGDIFDHSQTLLAEEAFNANSPLMAEEILNKARWRYLDELEFGHYFDIERLVIFFIKLQILERISLFDTEKGRDALDAVVSKGAAGTD
ncbi:MAG: V-type proton ATPase subunit E [Candidatus Scalindua rubra]|uniref:V-type proton ATPase subunit E n=1 Tax=Candidatus Scalindua rubra TaxID=1872076 RepID=A0A1E3X8T3_9BACT|nr:MAG: V-type proton ATPase subunit E [Candidatus Scalindua rubra]